jgi:hypothetical protein
MRIMLFQGRYAHHAVSRHPDGEALKIKAAKVLAA